jgi:hypothetical protein
LAGFPFSGATTFLLSYFSGSIPYPFSAETSALIFVKNLRTGGQFYQALFRAETIAFSSRIAALQTIETLEKTAV